MTTGAPRLRFWHTLACIALLCCDDSDASRVAGWKGSGSPARWDLPDPGAPSGAAGSGATLTLDDVAKYGSGAAVDVVCDPEQRLLYVTSRDGSVAEYDLRTRSKLRDWPLSGKLSGIDLSPDRRTLLIAAAQPSASAYVHRIDLASGDSSVLQVVAKVPSGYTYSVAFVDDERALVSVAGAAGAPTPLYMLWLSDGHSAAREVNGQDTLLVRSADRSVVTYLQTGSGTFGYYDVATDRFRPGPSQAAVATQWIAVNRDGTRFALLSDRELLLADRELSPRATHLASAGLQPLAAAFDVESDIGFLAWGASSNGLSGRIELFDASFVRRITLLDVAVPLRWPGEKGYGEHIELSDDGRYLFAITQSGVIAYPLVP